MPTGSNGLDSLARLCRHILTPRAGETVTAHRRHPLSSFRVTAAEGFRVAGRKPTGCLRPGASGHRISDTDIFFSKGLAMAEPTSKFQPQTLDFVARNARTADRIAKILGISPALLVGAVANEHDTRFNPDLYWKETGAIGQKLGDVLATVDLFNKEPIGHQEIEQNYNQLRAGEENWLGKLRNPAMVDVGPGNIRISTAVDLLHEYAEQHPDDDPLALKKYLGRYDALRDDLLKFDKPDTSLAMAGLMTKKAAPFFENIDSAAWQRLTPQQQEALGVMYYKMGPETLEKNISERRRKLNGAEFNFNPYGDGGEQHLNNSAGIAGALTVGRVQGEDAVPYVPEDEITKMRSGSGAEKADPGFTYDGHAAVSKMRGGLEGYRGYDTPRERLAPEQVASSPSAGDLRDTRETRQQWPGGRAHSTATPPASDRDRFWQDKVPGRGDFVNVLRRWPG